jgi:hypothetical protein
MLPPARAAASLPRASWKCVAAVLVFLAAGRSPVQAGGPIYLTAAGQPYRWDMSQPVRYTVNPGSFGSRSHAWAVAAIDRAYRTWQAVPTARMQILAASELTQTVTGTRFLPFLNGLKAGDPSPILLDDTGGMLNTLLGQGASASILGIGSPFVADPASGRIQVSFALLNGRLDREFSDNFVYGSFLHELGHTLNLAHSQVNAEELYDGDPGNDSLAAVMFYRGPNDDSGPSRDDQAWISWLYPSPDTAGTTATITGRVLLPDGVTGLQGIHVIARRVGDPQVTAVGAVSGYTFQNPVVFGLGGGLSDPAHLGDFLIPGLPPGNYTVELASLVSFPTVPVPVGYLVGGPKLWHKGPAIQDDTTASSLLAVKAGQQISGIDIMVNGDSLGDLKPVAERAPNMLPNPQTVTLPAVISGTVDNPYGFAAGHDIQSTDDLQRVYSVYLSDPMVVTAILSTANRGADLDLYLLGEQAGQPFIEAAAVQDGTPPEVVQLRLPPGRHYFGVHVAGEGGSAYTLRLLATPAPDPIPATPTTAMVYLLIGDVTSTSATARWGTTSDAPSVLYYNLPIREIGSPKQERVHALSMTNLEPGGEGTVRAFAALQGDPDELEAPFTAATSAATAGGSPHLALTSNHVEIFPGLELVTVSLTNAGSGDASQVKIQQLTPASGWAFAVPVFFGASLPNTLDVGGIGAGGAGSFSVLVLRTGGSAAAAVTLHGTYTDAAGAPLTF